jgi:hypothetical protein
MMARAWNAAVCRLWYAFDCPPRFPLRQIRNAR